MEGVAFELERAVGQLQEPGRPDSCRVVHGEVGAGEARVDDWSSPAPATSAARVWTTPRRRKPMVIFIRGMDVCSTTTEMLIYPGWETLVVPVSQLGTPGRDKRGGVLLSRIWQPGQKVLPAPHGWRTLLSRLVLPTGTKGPFFSCFPFLNSFLFQLYFCISIKFMYWNSVCMISTNIYIVTYIIFVLDSFHI